MTEVNPNESAKQVIDYKGLVWSDGKQYKDSEYVRKGIVELFLVTESLKGLRELNIQNDYEAGKWVTFIAQPINPVYKNDRKVRSVMDNFSTHKPHFFYDYFMIEIEKVHIDGEVMKTVKK